MNTLKDFFVAQLYFAAWRIIRWLPERSAYSFFRSIGSLVLRLNGKGVQRLRSNLARVKPYYSEDELDLLISCAMDSYMRYWCDTFRFQDWSKDRINSTVTVKNEHLLLDPIAAKSGVIVALPHAGNWDHAGAYFCSKGIHLVTVAERLKPEALFLRFLKYREAMGMEVLALDGRSLGTLAQRARSGNLIALVADRDLSRNGIDVNFFGHPARMPAGPALLAIKTGVSLITAFVSYTERGIHIEFREVAWQKSGDTDTQVKAITQKCADNFAAGIASAPEDWHMLQRIWIDGDFTEREVARG
jgi:KDO2-lipid IV(A) lauroyltransferase